MLDYLICVSLFLQERDFFHVSIHSLLTLHPSIHHSLSLTQARQDKKMDLPREQLIKKLRHENEVRKHVRNIIDGVKWLTSELEEEQNFVEKMLWREETTDALRNTPMFTPPTPLCTPTFGAPRKPKPEPTLLMEKARKKLDFASLQPRVDWTKPDDWVIIDSDDDEKKQKNLFK